MVVLATAIVMAIVVLGGRGSESESEAENVVDPTSTTTHDASIPRIDDLATLDPGMRSAVEAATSALERSPDNGDRWGELGMVYHAHQYFELAARAYEQARRLDPSEARWPYYLGVLATERGQRDRASELFERAITSDPSLVSARLRLASLLIDERRFDRARSELDAASKLAPDEPALHRLRGRLELEAGRASEARVLLERTLVSLPEDRETRYLLARALRQLGERERAGELLANLEQLSDVGLTDPLMSAVSTTRRDLKVVINSANHALQQGRIDDAVQLFESVIEQDPRHFDAHHNLGLIAGRQGRLADAERHMRSALDAEPRRPEPLWGLAMVTAQTGREDEAVGYLEKLLEAEPQHQRAAGLLAEIRARRAR